MGVLKDIPGCAMPRAGASNLCAGDGIGAVILACASPAPRRSSARPRR